MFVEKSFREQLGVAEFGISVSRIAQRRDLFYRLLPPGPGQIFRFDLRIQSDEFKKLRLMPFNISLRSYCQH